MAVTREQARANALLRLKALGVGDADEDLLVLNLDSTREELLAKINRKELPDGLLYVWADMAAGRTLLSVLSVSADEDGEGITGVVTSIKEGDTSVNFNAEMSQRGMLINEARRLATPPASTLARYRRLAW